MWISGYGAMTSKSLIGFDLAYSFGMQRKRRAVFNPAREAASTTPIASGRKSGPTAKLRPTQNRAGSFTCCEECGSPIHREIGESDIASLLRFFLILDRWDRESAEETVSMTDWEQLP